MIDAFRGVGAGAIDDSLLDGFIVARFFRREVAIGLAFRHQLLRRNAMLLSIVGLKDDPLVVIKAEPLQAFDDRAG